MLQETQDTVFVYVLKEEWAAVIIVKVLDKHGAHNMLPKVIVLQITVDQAVAE